MTAASEGLPEPGPDADKHAIEADIERTRNELGETVQALSEKLDVKERAKEKAAETKQQVVHKADEVKHTVADKADTVRHTVVDNPKRSVPVAAIVLIGALAVGIVVWRKRR
jgi:ElaB/YqjD/DUF883 family membrane-anchored ribosome-binding protein